jgi:hypothetical protein
MFDNVGRKLKTAKFWWSLWHDFHPNFMKVHQFLQILVEIGGYGNVRGLFLFIKMGSMLKIIWYSHLILIDRSPIHNSELNWNPQAYHVYFQCI